VPGYEDLHRIGHGGFSVVYRAHQKEIGRPVALKVLAVEFVDGRILRQFLREVQLTARLTGHPNVVTVLDSGMTSSGRPYIAMDFYDRGSLRDRLLADGPLPAREVLRIGVKIAGALEAAHREGMLHRDVKPQNILVSRYGEPALGDFGTARLTAAALDVSSRTEALTPVHAAPEVLQGEAATERSDVYSLGSTLYQLLEGRPAFQRSADTGIAPLLLRILTELPPPFTRTDVPEVLAAVVLRAMNRQPSERFASAGAMAMALQQVQAALGLGVTEIAEHLSGSTLLDPALAGPNVSSPWAPPQPAGPVPTADPGLADPPTSAAPPGPSARLGQAFPAAPTGTTAPMAPGEPPSGDVVLAATPWSGSDTMTGWRPPSTLGAEGAAEGSPARPERTDAFAHSFGDEPLIGISRQTTRRDRPPRKPVAALAVAAGAVVVVAAILSVVLVAAAGPRGNPQPGAQQTPGTSAATPTDSEITGTATAPPSVVPTVPANAAPTGLAAQTIDSTVRLTWTLPPNDNFPLALVQSPPTTMTILNSNTMTSYYVTGLDRATRYCFKVGAVISVGPPVVIEWSAPVCANG
jgi:serine/threonine protein kinase